MTITDHDLVIEPMGEDRIDAILGVYGKCEDFLSLGPVPKASPEMVLTDLAASRENGGIFCGIHLGKEGLVGVVDYIPKNYDGMSDRAFLSLLMIAEPFRCHGLGARVLGLIEDAIGKDAEISWLYSGVQVNNGRAIRFWLRMGFEISGGPELLPDKTTVYHLKKRISP